MLNENEFELEFKNVNVNVIVNCDFDFYCYYLCNGLCCPPPYPTPYPTPAPQPTVFDIINSRGELREQPVLKDLLVIVYGVNIIGTVYCYFLLEVSTSTSVSCFSLG